MGYSKDEEVLVTIEDIGTDGEGIGKIEGYTLFIKDAVVGDTVRAKIIKAKKNYGYARLIEIITPSKDRVEPVCEVARQCGGCQIMQMSYEAQLRYKRALVQGNLERIGGIKDVEVLPVIGMEHPYNYRNKAQYPVGQDKNGNIVMGFYAGRTHCIIDNIRCHIGAECNEQILATIKEYMINEKITAYNEVSHTGLVRHILIRKGYHTGQVMVCVVINGKTLPKSEVLVQMLRKLTFAPDSSTHITPVISSVMLNINQKDTNVILGDTCKVLWGEEYIEDTICDIRFRISPLSFFQVNPVQTEKLYSKALEFAGLTGNEIVWDMYCGIGTISLLMATKARKVYGVEIVPQAIENAKDNARNNSFDNAEFYVGKAEEIAPQLIKEAVPDVIMVDPPRKGCDEALLDTIIKTGAERVVYVSCDSATLARDLKFLTANGYQIKAVQPVDQFAHSVHIECVVMLSRI